MLSTKADYEYIRSESIPGWQQEWRQLLEGRFVNDCVEDQNAPIFRLGFTVEEISEAIGFSGLTDREIEWRESQPDRWRLINGDWQEIDGWAEAREAKSRAQMLETKLAEIQLEKCKIRDSGVTVNGILFDTDASAQGMYTQTLMMMQLNTGFVVHGWKASTGVYIDLDEALLMQVLEAWKELITTLTIKQAEKEAELKIAESIDDYDVTVGWL